LSEPLLLVGYGRMGRLVEPLAGEFGMHVAGVVDRAAAARPDAWPAADVAIDFSIREAVPRTLAMLAARGTNVVIGTTGWQDHEPALRAAVERAGIGVVAAANFSIGVNLFTAMVEQAASLMVAYPAFGAYLHELHHAAKRDAPSGTALALHAAMTARGYDLPVNVASTRAGSIPGTHTVGFDAPAETITLTHTARDRTGFARGALEAARWVRGKRGWFTMRDVLRLSSPEPRAPSPERSNA
jgi:4-hydroxy-tetrahydrodipicolinate reductase